MNALIRVAVACTFAVGLLVAHLAASEAQVLEPRLKHLRLGGPREWTTFAETPEGERLEVKFNSPANDREWTLQLRQQDVKQTWSVLLNGDRIERLPVDENDMVVYFALSAGAIRQGENTLRVEMNGRGTPDDVRLGEVILHRQPRSELLNACTLEVAITDADTRDRLPARVTVVAETGAMQTVGAQSNDQLAVRPGLVYTSNGKAKFGLPAGKYTVYAGRGFEYTLASESIELKTGQTRDVSLTIRREVPTPGYVACDTHTHTLTHSGHGDATVQERMITLAAEGIELPIATDHNVQIDQDPFAREMGVRQYFTPVIGNEVTTKVGHFNVFPVAPGAAKPDHQLTDWSALFDSIYGTPGVKVAILNHARDLHSGVRPFGPTLFNAAAGENLDNWAMRFNAMEVVNSSATQNDIWRLFHDWMALLNRGRQVTPVGASDSHDVGRHFVGQGRTYIRCDDRDPGNLDVEQAVDNFVQGRVLVSYGLLAELTVNGKFRSGELAAMARRASTNEPAAPLEITIRVLAPSWIEASRIVLFANGHPIREAKISNEAKESLGPGEKWRGQWSIPCPAHDLFLTAIAIGPGIDGPYWKTAKPYQPTSPDWTPQVIGCSGAVWIDGDGDGRKSAAYDYARRLVTNADGDFQQLLTSLADYDRATATQAAHLWQSAGEDLLSDSIQNTLRRAGEETQAGFQTYLEAWRENQMARAGR